jgi:hypothetical protein
MMELDWTKQRPELYLEADTAAACLGGKDTQEDRARVLLRNLRDTWNFEGAQNALQSLHESIEELQDNCQWIRHLERLHIVPVIFLALQKWLHSELFVGLAASLLATITFHSRPSRDCVVNIGGISILLMSVRAHDGEDDLDLYADFILILKNISENDFKSHLKQEVATRDCIEFVITLLEDYPSDADIQIRGCEYLESISKLVLIRKTLVDQGISVLLASIVDRYLETNCLVVQAANDAAASLLAP